MSRSRKKPYVGDNKSGKPLHSRRYRRKVKQIVKHYCKQRDGFSECWGCNTECNRRCSGDEPVIPVRKEIVNWWDICDYFCYYPEDPRSYRK